MKEIITLHVGGCGSNLAREYWKCISKEHGIESNGEIGGNTTPDQASHLNVSFSSTSWNHFVPRALLLDLEPSSTHRIRSSSLGKLLKPSNVIAPSGSDLGGGNFAKAYYGGNEIIEEMLDSIRLEVEMADYFQGFSMVHALGGGTGSGLGSLLLTRLHEEYVDRCFSTFTIFPSLGDAKDDINSHMVGGVTEPYNCLLALPDLIQFASTGVFSITNDAVLRMATTRYHKEEPQSMNSTNFIIANFMANATSSFRFPGALNSSLRSLGVNLIPFPRLHFFCIGQSPCFRQSFLPSMIGPSSIKELVVSSLKRENLISTIDPANGKFLTASCIFRGPGISPSLVEKQLFDIQQETDPYFVEFIPNSIKTSIVKVAQANSKTQSCTTIGNNTAITENFSKIVKQAQNLLEKKAFLHYFTQEGVEEVEFQEAIANVSDLCEEYDSFS